MKGIVNFFRRAYKKWGCRNGLHYRGNFQNPGFFGFQGIWQFRNPTRPPAPFAQRGKDRTLEACVTKKHAGLKGLYYTHLLRGKAGMGKLNGILPRFSPYLSGLSCHCVYGRPGSTVGVIWLGSIIVTCRVGLGYSLVAPALPEVGFPEPRLCVAAAISVASMVGAAVA